MRKIFLFAFLGILLHSCMGLQGVPVTMEPIEHQFQVDKNKDDLYVSANNWMVENFNDAKSVIQFTDKEAGVVTGKYLLKSSYNYEGYTATETDIFAIIKIQVKDGASKITITPDNFNSVSSSMVDPKYQYTKEMAETQVKHLIASYEEYIKNDNSEVW